MTQKIKNISEALIEISPEFMTLLDVGTSEKKMPEPEGGLKYIAWITMWNFKITSRSAVSEFGKIQFQPNTTDEYDTEDEALEAAWGFINMWISQKWVFLTILSEWATE